MRIIATGLAAALLAGCASPDHRVDHNGDVLSPPQHGETLGETILREGLDQDGCLAPGNASRNRRDGILGFPNPCRDLAELITPPEYPEPPPPPPSMPDNR